MGCIKCGLQVSSVPLQFHGVGKNSDLIFYPQTPEQLAEYNWVRQTTLKAPTRKYVVEVCNAQNYSCVDTLIKESKINVLPGWVNKEKFCIYVFKYFTKNLGMNSSFI